MNAKQIADELENIYWIQGDGKGKPFQQYADFVRQQQAEIEALKNGFNTTWAGTNNSEMAEVRAMANRCILKIQELEFEQEGFENLVEMLESEKEELVEKTRQQQAEIERLIGAKPITYGMLTFCKNCGQQNPYFEKEQNK